MKKIVPIILFALSVAASARAATPSALNVGLEVGYLTDWKEAYFSAHLGYELKADPSLSHLLEVQIGYTEKSESDFGITVRGKIVPITLNYRGVVAAQNKFGCYFGVGAGVARTSISGSAEQFLDGSSGLFTISDSASSLALHGFTGISYRPTETTSLHLGAEYIWIDDINILGTKVKVGDDFGITAGVSFRF